MLGSLYVVGFEFQVGSCFVCANMLRVQRSRRAHVHVVALTEIHRSGSFDQTEVPRYNRLAGHSHAQHA